MEHIIHWFWCYHSKEGKIIFFYQKLILRLYCFNSQEQNIVIVWVILTIYLYFYHFLFQISDSKPTVHCHCNCHHSSVKWQRAIILCIINRIHTLIQLQCYIDFIILIFNQLFAWTQPLLVLWLSQQIM